MNKVGEVILVFGFMLLFITMSILDSENHQKVIITLSIVSVALIFIGGFIAKIF